jgi:hypothetical protein
MKESHEEGVAVHLAPESYADGGNTMGVALIVGAHAGQPLSSEISTFRVPTLSNCGEGNTRHGVIGKPCRDAAESETLCMRSKAGIRTLWRPPISQHPGWTGYARDGAAASQLCGVQAAIAMATC